MGKQATLFLRIWFHLNAFLQFTGNTAAFKTHDALFRKAETQQIDAAVPGNLMINYRKFLVNFGFENQTDAT